MNERIVDDLVLKARASAITDTKDGGKQFNLEVFHRKFAELIVRECLHIVGNNNPCPPGTTIMYSLIQDEYFDKGWQVAVETKSNQIKKHFGVKQ